MHFKQIHNIIFGFLTGACIFLWGCDTDVSKKKEIKIRKTGTEEAKDVIVNYTIAGNTKTILKSPLMYNVQEAVPYIEFPKTLTADFYNDSGKIESKLFARYGKYNQNSSVVFLKDSITIINILKGDTLYCQELHWDRNKTGTEFYTDKPVRIRTKTEIIDGKGMESSQDFKNWHILKPLGRVSVPAAQFPQ
jgi:LPS export ABC transporter protein LptC